MKAIDLDRFANDARACTISDVSAIWPIKGSTGHGLCSSLCQRWKRIRLQSAWLITCSKPGRHTMRIAIQKA